MLARRDAFPHKVHMRFHRMALLTTINHKNQLKRHKSLEFSDNRAIIEILQKTRKYCFSTLIQTYHKTFLKSFVLGIMYRRNDPIYEVSKQVIVTWRRTHDGAYGRNEEVANKSKL